MVWASNKIPTDGFRARVSALGFVNINEALILRRKRENSPGPGGGFRRIGGPKKNCQPACKPGSVWRLGKPTRVTAIPLGRILRSASSNQPGRRPGNRLKTLPPSVIPIRFCSRWGLPCRDVLPPARCALTAPFHPYPEPEGSGRFAFCGAFPEVTLAGRYPAPCFHGARTFLCQSSGRPADWRDAL